MQVRLSGMTATVRAVLFDLGGVLVQIRPTWDEVLGFLGRGIGWTDGPKGLNDFDFMVRYQDGQLSDEAYLEAMAEGFWMTREEAGVAHSMILKGSYPGTLALVEELEARGVVTGCLSNTNALHWVDLRNPERFPQVARLEHGLASHELQLSKPDARIYAAAEARCVCSGAEIGFFDDWGVSVEAARAQGWRAVQIDPAGDTAGQMRAALVDWGVLD